jgi:hypothetical protein
VEQFWLEFLIWKFRQLEFEFRQLWRLQRRHGSSSGGGNGGWGDKKATSPSGSDSGSTLHKFCTQSGCTYHLSSCPVAVTPPPSTGGSGHGSPMSAISLSSDGSHKAPIYISVKWRYCLY